MSLATKPVLTNLLLYIVTLAWWRCFPVTKPNTAQMLGEGLWVVGTALSTLIWSIWLLWTWI